jgi:hypothetical protein
MGIGGGKKMGKEMEQDYVKREETQNRNEVRQKRRIVRLNGRSISWQTRRKEGKQD